MPRNPAPANAIAGLGIGDGRLDRIDEIEVVRHVLRERVPPTCDPDGTRHELDAQAEMAADLGEGGLEHDAVVHLERCLTTVATE